MSQLIKPCLWFNGQAEEAANFYVSIFPNSTIGKISRYSKEGQDIHQQPEGAVMTVEFSLNGQNFMGLNGGPNFKFNEAVSLVINCKNQEEVDHYWGRLTEGGDPNAQVCGWLKDKFGLSWQVVPEILPKLLTHPDPVKADRAMKAMMGMKKIVISELTSI